MTRPVGPALPTVAEVSADRYLIPYLFHRVASRYQQLWWAEQDSRGRSIHRWQVLSLLIAADGRRVGQIAELADVAQPVLSRVIDQMERDGDVERRRGEGDRRAVSVWLTAAGRRTFASLLPKAAELVDHSLADLDDDEVATLHELVLRVLVRLDEEESRV